jgi:hypothetical protein
MAAASPLPLPRNLKPHSTPIRNQRLPLVLHFTADSSNLKHPGRGLRLYLHSAFLGKTPNFVIRVSATELTRILLSSHIRYLALIKTGQVQTTIVHTHKDQPLRVSSTVMGFQVFSLCADCTWIQAAGKENLLLQLIQVCTAPSCYVICTNISPYSHTIFQC